MSHIIHCHLIFPVYISIIFTIINNLFIAYISIFYLCRLRRMFYENTWIIVHLKDAKESLRITRNIIYSDNKLSSRELKRENLKLRLLWSIGSFTYVFLISHMMKIYLQMTIFRYREQSATSDATYYICQSYVNNS